MVLQNDGAGEKYTVVFGTTPVIDGNWHQLTAVNDGSKGGAVAGISLYVDGKLEKMNVMKENLGENTILNDVPVTVGSRENGGVPSRGIIDEVMIFKKALNAQEVQQIYQAKGVAEILGQPSTVQPGGKLITTWSIIKSGYMR